MKREIKFRAWDRVRKIIVNVVMLSFEQDVLGFDDSDAIEYGNTRDFELMQYTGLKDVNGKDIYEGDVVEFEVSLTRTKAEVKYSRNQFIVSMNSVMPRSLDLYLVKIIGNRFENPELLEER